MFSISHLKYAALTLIIVASVVLPAACVGNETLPTTTPQAGESPTPTQTPAEPETITWSYWGDPWEAEVNQRLVTVFEADYPNIKVETRHAPWTEYFNKVEEWWANGTPPDVMFLDYLPTYASRGLLENLDPYIQRDNYSLTDFYPGLLEYLKYKGSLFGLPRDNDTKVIFYNKTLFDEAGLPYPTSGWTWEDLRQTAIKLTKSEDGNITQYGFAYEPDDWWLLWVHQNGGEVYDNYSNPTKTLMDSSEAIEAVQWLANLTNIDKVTPPYDVQRTSLNIGQLFQDGKLAMAFGNHALVPAFAKIPGLRWDVVGLPQKVNRVNAAGGSGYVISSASKHKEAAWTFLKWLEGPKGQAVFTETGVMVPARRSVGQADVFLKQQPPHNAQVFLEETELGRPNPMFKGVQQVTSLFNEAFVPVWKGQMTAKEAIDEVVPRVDNLLSELSQ